MAVEGASIYTFEPFVASDRYASVNVFGELLLSRITKVPGVECCKVAVVN